MGPSSSLSYQWRPLLQDQKPDYEMPADANRDNVYELTVRASDGTMYADRMVRVTVADANEPPMILGFGLKRIRVKER